MTIMAKAPCKCGEDERIFIRTGCTKFSTYHYVCCARCGRKTKQFDTAEGAVRAWNKKMGAMK